MRMLFLTILSIFFNVSNALCLDTLDMKLSLYANPGFIVEGDTTKIFSFVQGADSEVTYEWSPKECIAKADRDSSIVRAFPRETTTFVLTITCGSQSVTDSIKVKVLSTPREFTLDVVDNDVYLKWQSVETARLYRVRRNGETIVNFLQDTVFVDRDVADGSYCYAIISARDELISPETEKRCVDILDLAEEKGEAEIYPNPTKGELNVKMQGLKSVVIYDMTGRMLLDETSEGEVTVDLSGFDSGIYLLKMETDSDIFTRKINLIK